MRQWLKDAREALEITQEEIAELAGIKQSAYCVIELGLRNPSVKVAQRIGKFLKVKWTTFYTEGR